MEQLTESIRQQGVLNPIMVRPMKYDSADRMEQFIKAVGA